MVWELTSHSGGGYCVGSNPGEAIFFFLTFFFCLVFYLCLLCVCVVLFFDHMCPLHFSRLRVVPHSSSGTVEQAKRARAWKSTQREKATRDGEREKFFFFPHRVSAFSRGVIFTHARVSLSLLSLRKNGGLLVVYVFPESPLNTDTMAFLLVSVLSGFYCASELR